MRIIALLVNLLRPLDLSFSVLFYFSSEHNKSGSISQNLDSPYRLNFFPRYTAERLPSFPLLRFYKSIGSQYCTVNR